MQWDKGHFMGVAIDSGSTSITSLLFVDDCFIIGQATLPETAIWKIL